MITYYMTEEEAEKALNKLDKTPKYFCPLINNICRMDCVCYFPFQVRKTFHSGVHKYIIYGGYCSNTMFIGEQS